MTPKMRSQEPATSKSHAEEVDAPSILLALTELPRALIELGMLPLAFPILSRVPRGDGHPVLVLPGFGADDSSTVLMRKYLKTLGYDAHGWGLGRNMGPKTAGRNSEKLIQMLDATSQGSGQKVSLVGWSLGGIMARIMARRSPHAVRQVISLGSPFLGNTRATNVHTAYRLLTGHNVNDEPERSQLVESRRQMPVPSTAIFTKADGIVAWQNCMDLGGHQVDNIEVPGSHCGLGVNASVLFAVADRLAQADGHWKPFHRSGRLRSMVYPQVGKF